MADCPPLPTAPPPLQISTAPGEVIKPDAFKRISDEGMPVHGRPYQKGNLYVRFVVDFPEQLTPEQQTAIRAVLPGGDAANGAMEEDDVEEVRMRCLGMCCLFMCCCAACLCAAVLPVYVLLCCLVMCCSGAANPCCYSPPAETLFTAGCSLLAV